MLDPKDSAQKRLLFQGFFGLEKESLRVTPDGFMAHTPHHTDHPGIVRDFCENQPEINTQCHPSLEGAMEEMHELNLLLQKTAADHNELIWPFSSPCKIRDEKDIPIARYEGSLAEKTAYREYLAGKYGRYKMTFSGIHFNFSFPEKLLMLSFEQSDNKEKDYSAFREAFYLDLAAKASCYGWIISALCSASPLLDGSFFEKHLIGQTIFDGMGSIRDGEQGYWNFFTPLFDYSSLENYIRSIEKYEQNGLLKQASELYYPVRLKPYGVYSLDNLRERGISHLELRMLDLNPLCADGMDSDDLRFIHLLLVWMACSPKLEMNEADQIYAIQNFKSAARFDLSNARIVYPDDTSLSVLEAAIILLEVIDSFFDELPEKYQSVIEKQKQKLLDPFHHRYAWIVRQDFGDEYIGLGLKLARDRQKQALWEIEYEEGRRTMRLSCARRMLEPGTYPIEIISRVTQLSAEEIEALRNQMNTEASD